MIRKIGKIGQINAAANKKLHKEYDERDIRYCELRFAGCWMEPNGFAHRHKRRWYRGREHLLSAFNQTLLSCNRCHDAIEDDPELTEAIFLEKRGEENG